MNKHACGCGVHDYGQVCAAHMRPVVPRSKWCIGQSVFEVVRVHNVVTGGAVDGSARGLVDIRHGTLNSSIGLVSFGANGSCYEVLTERASSRAAITIGDKFEQGARVYTVLQPPNEFGDVYCSSGNGEQLYTSRFLLEDCERVFGAKLPPNAMQQQHAAMVAPGASTPSQAWIATRGAPPRPRPKCMRIGQRYKHLDGHHQLEGDVIAVMRVNPASGFAVSAVLRMQDRTIVSLSVGYVHAHDITPAGWEFIGGPIEQASPQEAREEAIATAMQLAPIGLREQDWKAVVAGLSARAGGAEPEQLVFLAEVASNVLVDYHKASKERDA